MRLRNTMRANPNQLNLLKKRGGERSNQLDALLSSIEKRDTLTLSQGGPKVDLRSRLSIGLLDNPLTAAENTDLEKGRQVHDIDGFVNGRHHDTGETFHDYRIRKLGILYGETEQLPEVTSLEQFHHNIEAGIQKILEHENITLSDEEAIQITIDEKTKKYRVSGLKDREKQQKIQLALNSEHVIDGQFRSTGSLYTLHNTKSEYVQSAPDYKTARYRENLIATKNHMRNQLRNAAGKEVDLHDFYLDSEGNIKGYPKELAWVFETRPSGIRGAEAESIRHYLRPLLREGVDNIPDFSPADVDFTYSNQRLAANL